MFRDRPKDWKRDYLSALGVSCVVCLTTGRDPDLDVLLGEGYVYSPFPDGRVDPEVFRRVIGKAVDVGDLMESGGSVLTHCRAGRNRSALFSALLVVRLLCVSGADSIRVLQTRRPKSLHNEKFVDFLRRVKSWNKKKHQYEIENWDK